MAEDKVDLTISYAMTSTEEVYAYKDKVPSLEQFEALENTVRKVFGGWQQREEAETFSQECGKRGWDIEVFKDKEGYYTPYVTFVSLSKSYQNKDKNSTYFKMFKLGEETYASIDFFFWEIPQVAGFKTYPSHSKDRLIMLRGNLKQDEFKFLPRYKLFRIHSDEGGVETIPCFWDRVRGEEESSPVGRSYDTLFYNNLIYWDDPYFANEFKKFYAKYRKKMLRKGFIPFYGGPLGGGEWFEKKRTWERGMVDAVRKEQDVLDIRRPECVEVKNG